MSTPATVLVVYFAIGAFLMTVAIASSKRTGRSDTLLPAGGDDPVGAGLFIFVMLLWPIWLLVELSRKEEESSTERDKDPKR